MPFPLPLPVPLPPLLSLDWCRSADFLPLWNPPYARLCHMEMPVPHVLVPSVVASPGVVAAAVKGGWTNAVRRKNAAQWDGNPFGNAFESNMISRCHRLNKECRVPPGRRKARPLSKTVQLERKMDGLMLLLTSSAGRTNLPTPIQVQADAQRLEQTEAETEREDEDSEADEEESLHAFRTHRLQFLPLIHIPATTTAQDLKRQSPFLWRCITAVESKHAARQAALCVSIRELAGKRLLVDCDKSLDLLQGVLVYLAWYGFLSSHGC